MTALLVLGCIALPVAFLALLVIAWLQASWRMDRQLQQLRHKRDLERWSNDW